MIVEKRQQLLSTAKVVFAGGSAETSHPESNGKIYNRNLVIFFKHRFDIQHIDVEANAEKAKKI